MSFFFHQGVGVCGRVCVGEGGGKLPPALYMTSFQSFPVQSSVPLFSLLIFYKDDEKPGLVVFGEGGFQLGWQKTRWGNNPRGWGEVLL